MKNQKRRKMFNPELEALKNEVRAQNKIAAAARRAAWAIQGMPASKPKKVKKAKNVKKAKKKPARIIFVSGGACSPR
jgi:hypothetical protein